jgi:ferrous iron transport protein A
MTNPEPKHQNSPVCNPDRNSRILNCDRSGRTFNSGHRRHLFPFRRVEGVRQVSVLSELKVGETGVLIALDLPESVQNHLMHMGFVPNAFVKALRRAPAGDPTVYGIDGLEIALRHETAEAIRVRSLEAESKQAETKQVEAKRSLTEKSTIAQPTLVEAAR